MQRRDGDGDGLHAGTLPIVHSTRTKRSFTGFGYRLNKRKPPGPGLVVTIFIQPSVEG
jgi:hypothetical protein